MLRSPLREYYIKEVKEPMLKAVHNFNNSSFMRRIFFLIEIMRLARKYPEVTMSNAKHTNTKRLLKIEEKFFEEYPYYGRNDFWRTFFRVLNTQYDHASEYKVTGDWFVNELINSGWEIKQKSLPESKNWRK
jgi:hypothetical protein